MADGDQDHWDQRYSQSQADPEPGIPEHFAAFADVFASCNSALEIACGPGRFATWLALKGVNVSGYDISPVAIAQATALAAEQQVTQSCVFSCADFDAGLPVGQPVDLVVCNMFRDARLDSILVERLAPGGILAIAALSEVGAEPGRFRARQGELTEAFAAMTMLGADEADGLAWFVGQAGPVGG